MSDIVSLLGKKGRKLLFYHQDGDGISSAALVLKVFPDFRASAREGPRVEGDLLESIAEKKPGVLLFLDLPVDQESEKMKQLRKKLPATDMAVIDHHIPEADLNSFGIIHINPRFKDSKAYIANSYLVYDILRGKFPKEMEGSMWIAAVGVISDYAFRECKGFLKRLKKKHPELLNTELDENIFSSKLGELSRMMSSAITLKGLKGAAYILEVMIKAGTCDDFMADRKIRKWHRIVEGEMKRLVDDFGKNHKTAGDVLVYKVESRLNVSSVLASRLARKHPDSIILLGKESSSGCKVSVRGQDPASNLGSAVKKSAQGIGMGGGHERAAGALVKDWERFKRRFLKEASKA